MTSIDQENIRRAQAERRIAMNDASDGSSGTWFLGIVVLVAIIGGILLFSGGDGTTEATVPATADGTAPAAVEEAVPAAPATE